MVKTMVSTYQVYNDRCHPHHTEVLSRVVQTQELMTLELMTLVCVMFGLPSDSLIGRLEGNLLGGLQLLLRLTATTLSRVLRGFTPCYKHFSDIKDVSIA